MLKVNLFLGQIIRYDLWITNGFRHELTNAIFLNVKLLYHLKNYLYLLEVNKLLKGYLDIAFWTGDLLRRAERLGKYALVYFAEVEKIQMLAISASDWDPD
jgi:hypothetical protein